MITLQNVSLKFGNRTLFKDVNLTFTAGNCYGLIGANGAGKSTFLKLLSGEIEASSGDVHIPRDARMAVLKQDQFQFDDYSVLQTVCMGHKKLYDIMCEREALYAKASMTEADGIRAAELEAEFAEMNGWEAESEAGKLLSGLGLKEDLHHRLMKELEAGDKVRVLVAQALFGNPDILLMDEPTNHLDAASVLWLEEFLIEFKNLVIVVSHDRHFLDKVCTHVADIDFQQVTLYSGNYSFWVEASQLAQKQRREQNRKNEDKAKELQEFISRFANNASKNRQATSRKKLLEKINIEDIKPSSRKYPHIVFKMERESGNDLLTVDGLAADVEGREVFRNLDLVFNKGDKVAFVGQDGLAATTLFQILMEEAKPKVGSFKWGASTTRAYFPRDNKVYFEADLSLIDWLRQYTKNRDEDFVRGFLGKMLFTGEESLKSVRVLSGGEKVRCMLSRMMMIGANVLIMDEPTNHLDLEAITALNNALIDFKGTLLFTSQDHQLLETVATRIVEIGPNGHLDKLITYDNYVTSDVVRQQRLALYAS